MINDIISKFISDETILSIPFSEFGENNLIFKRKIKIVAIRYLYHGEVEPLVRFLNEMLSHWDVERRVSIQEILSK